MAKSTDKVTLAVLRHVVGREREHHLGLHDEAWIQEQPPDRLADLYEQFHSITDNQFTALCQQHDLNMTNLSHLCQTLTDQLDEQDLHDAVYGRNPDHDPSLPDLSVGSSA